MYDKSMLPYENVTTDSAQGFISFKTEAIHSPSLICKEYYVSVE